MPSHVDYSMKSIDLAQKTLMGRLGECTDLSGADLGLIQADAALGAPRNRLFPTQCGPLAAANRPYSPGETQRARLTAQLARSPDSRHKNCRVRDYEGIKA